MSVQARAQQRIQPRAIFCPIENLYTSRMVAENACLGRFTHAGITLELGTNPDWLHAGEGEDLEWRIEWSKFYYGLDLAAAYVETHDRKFLSTWETLVHSWILQVPYDYDVPDVIGRRIQNWIYAWQKFASAPVFHGFVHGLEEEILASLGQQVRHLATNLSPERNHRTLELYGLFVAALALPEVTDDGLQEFAVNQLHANLLSDIRPDGVHREHSTHYHMLVLRSFLALRENARRFGIKLPPGYDARLEKACEFAMHFQRPDGEIPALSDSDSGNYSDLLELAASLLDRPDFLYVATAGAKGEPPATRYVSFPNGGYYIQRSGWGDGEIPFEHERFLIFDCGALGDGGHGHYDLLNAEISGNGRPLIVDPGRYTYAEQTPNLRHWFKGTPAHSTVCVDGKDQVAYRRGKPKGPLPEAHLIERWSAPGFDMLCGVARSPEYEAVHTRRIFFIADEYWVIHDQLRGTRPHRFDLRFHLSANAWEKTSVVSHDSQTVLCAPGMAMVFDPGKTATIEAGWIAPLYGVKMHAPVVSVVSDGASCADFLTVISPFGSHQQLPKFHVSFDQSDASHAVSLQIERAGSDEKDTDHLRWSSAIANHEAGPFHCRASAVWWRSGSRTPSSLVACNVQELRWSKDGKREFFSTSAPSPWLRWDEDKTLTLPEGDYA